MLAAFIEMKDYVNSYLDASSNGLTDFILTNAQWDAIEDLVYVLKVRMPLLFHITPIKPVHSL